MYRLFHALDDGQRPISVIFPYLPIEAHRKRDKSRVELSAIFAKVIQDRRAKGVKEDDALQSFMDAKYKNGGGLTEDQVTISSQLKVLQSRSSLQYCLHCPVDLRHAHRRPLRRSAHEQHHEHLDRASPLSLFPFKA